MPLSPELAVMLAPARSYARLRDEDYGHWLSRPAILLLAIGSGVSLMATGRLTLRLILPAAIYGTVVAALEILSLALVARGVLPFRKTVAVFFAGHGPWLLWMLAWAGCWALLPSAVISRYAESARSSLVLIFLWSAYLDYRFFQITLGRRPAAALRSLVQQRLICWPAGAALFVAPAAWAVVMGALRL